MEMVSCGQLTGSEKLPFKKSNKTRWLVKARVLKRILDNWNVLITYFTGVLPSIAYRSRFKVKMMLDMLKDPINKLYFQFVTPLIATSEQVNALFQHKKGDPNEMYQELISYHRSVKNRVYNHLDQRRPAETVEFGVKFTLELAKFVRQEQEANAEHYNHIILPAVNVLKARCHDFLLELEQQVRTRIPSTTGTLQKLSKFHPAIVLSQVSRERFSDLPFLEELIPSDDLAAAQDEYDRILYYPWSREYFNGKQLKDVTAEEFWSKVLNHQLSTGRFPFKILAKYVLTLLTFAVSNAQSERLFSICTNVKTKYRNRLKIASLDAVMNIRAYMQRNGICCNKYNISRAMLDRFKDTDIYRNPFPPFELLLGHERNESPDEVAVVESDSDSDVSMDDDNVHD